MHYDVFNGDADGICSLHQLRLAFPKDSTLVTGVKADIFLLARVRATPGDSVTALDISPRINKAALQCLLDQGITVEYFDHHSADIASHPLLHAMIDTAPQTCTGIIVDRYLHGAQRIWAAVAAYGDNFHAEAKQLGRLTGLSDPQLVLLRDLGECINYNAYGDTTEDLVVHPATLYTILHRYPDPFHFMKEAPIFSRIRESRDDDLRRARLQSNSLPMSGGRIIALPDAPWSRRVRGVYANELAHAASSHAHALLTVDKLGGYTISVRAPVDRPDSADVLCRQFATGGGRPAAGSIAHLPSHKLQTFIEAFEKTWPLQGN